MSRSGSNTVLFKCIKCDEYFKSVTALSAHSVTHQEAGVFRCKKCNISFLHLSLLEEHFTQVHRPYSCPECGLSFAERKTMSIHRFKTHLNIMVQGRDDENIHSKRQKIHICKHTSDVNKLVFLSDNPTETPENNVESKEVEIGRKDDHSYAKRYNYHPKECTERRENFTSPELLKRHIETEHMSDVNNLAFWRENPTKTPENNVENCEVIKEGKGENNAEIPPVTSANDTEIQEKDCTTETVIPKEKSESNIVRYKCLKCDKCYDSMTELSVHIDSHLEDPVFRCTTCGFCFMHPSFVTNHLKEAHGQVSPDGLMEDHMNTDLVETLYECPLCKQSFTEQKTMSLHKCQNQRMTTKKEFVCGDCGLPYKHISSLRTHVLYQHMKSELFLCEKCGKDFKYKWDLKIHFLHIHKDTRLFICKDPAKTPENSLENDDDMEEDENDAEILAVKSANDIESNIIVLFKCLSCDKSFASSIELSVHNESHQEDAVYKCTTCCLCFTQLSLLTNHFKEAHGQVSPDGLLEDHMNTDLVKAPYQCPVCRLSFPEWKIMSLHKCQNQRMPTKEKYYCGDCGESLVWCEECGKSCTSLTVLKGHEFAYSAVQTQKCTESICDCRYCGKMFTTRYRLNTHLGFYCECTPGKNYLKPEDWLFKCEECESRFRYFYELKAHTSHMHTIIKPFKCVECEKCFASSVILNLHMKTHRTVEPLLEDPMNTHLHKYIHQGCDCKRETNLSGYQANTPTSKVREEQGIIYVERQKLCSDGGETFTTWNLLQKHQAEHPYKCGLCQSRFKHTYELQLHQLRVHEDDKSFKCGGCGMCFASVKTHSRHMKTHLAFKCGHIGCTQAFCTRSQLNQHQEIHSSAEPDKSGNSSADADESKQYPCLYCKERFVTFSEAQTHIKSHGELQLEHVQMKSGINTINVDFNSSVLDKDANIDSDIKPHACLRCRQCFSTESDFDAHMKTHMDCFHSVSADDQNSLDCKQEGSQSFACLQGNKCYSTTSDLEAHNKVHNDSESMSDLDYLHLNNERPLDFDDDPKPYPCLACHKTFTSNSDLGIHMKTHVNVKSEDSSFVNGELNVRF